MNHSISYKKGFIPYALAALLIGLVGGFSTVLGPAFVKDLGIAYNNTTWTALAQAISTAGCAPILGKAGDFIGRRRTLLLGDCNIHIGKCPLCRGRLSLVYDGSTVYCGYRHRGNGTCDPCVYYGRVSPGQNGDRIFIIYALIQCICYHRSDRRRSSGIRLRVAHDAVGLYSDLCGYICRLRAYLKRSDLRGKKHAGL